MASVSATTAAYVAIAASTIGAGVGAVGAVNSANAQADAQRAQASAAEYQNQVDQQNAQNARDAAVDAQKSGAAAQAQNMIQARAILGKERTALAANGVDANSGSALDLQSDTAAQGQQDVLTTRYNYDRQSYGDMIQNQSYTNQAQLDQMRENSANSAASTASTAGAFGAASSILGGAKSVASDWYYMNKAPAGVGGGGLA